MARQLIVLWAGRRRRKPWESLCAEYRGRIERHFEVRDRRVRVRHSDDPARRSAEGQAMLDTLPAPCWTIALDPKGRMRSSEELASELRRLADEWPHPVAFLIGSDLGLDPEVTAAARQRLSLGPMTLGHELARLVLYEQIYRAISIDRGIKYHRAVF